MTVEELTRTRPLLTGFTGLYTELDGGANSVLNVNEDGEYIGPISGALPFITVGFDDGCNYVCDGISDEVQINAAILALQSTGGTIFLDDGDYYLYAGITAAASHIKITGSANAVLHLRNSTNSAMIQFGDGVTTYTDITIEGLQFDGNKSGQSVTSGSSGACIFVSKCSNVVIRDIKTTNARTYGVFLQNTTFFTVEDCYMDSPGGSYSVLAAGDGVIVFTGCAYGLVQNVKVNNPYRIGVTVDSSSTHVSYVGLRNCTVIGGDRGYHVELADYCSVIGCVTINNTGAVFNPTPTTNETASPAIMVGNNTTNIQVTNNIINNGQGGILTLTSFKDTVSNNLVTNMAWYGVFVRHESGGDTSVTVTGNVISLTTTDGIYLSGARKNTITGNTISATTGRGIYAVSSATNNAIKDNTINSPTSSGIELNNNGYTQIEGNVVSGAGLNGIRIVRCSYNQIKGNKLYNSSQTTTNTSSGISLETSSGTPSTYNIVEGNIVIEDATNKARYSITESASTDDNNQIINNIVTGAVTKAINVNGINSVVRNNTGANPDALYVQGNVSGTTTFNRVNGSTITATLTDNVTTTITDGISRGDTLVLVLTQDSTGSRTISKPANVKLVGGAFSPTSTANATDIWKLEWNGSAWIEISRSLNIS